MSQFDQLFGQAASVLMSVFGETEPASYQPMTGDPQSLSVLVDRGVQRQDVLGAPVSPSVEISWLRADRATHQRNDVIVLAGGERWRLSELTVDDGLMLAYRVIPA